MANLHQLIMGQAFQNALGSAAREQTSMQNLATHAGQLANQRVDDAKRAKIAERRRLQSVDEAMKLSNEHNTNSNKFDDIEWQVGKDGIPIYKSSSGGTAIKRGTLTDIQKEALDSGVPISLESAEESGFSQDDFNMLNKISETNKEQAAIEEKAGSEELRVKNLEMIEKFTDRIGDNIRSTPSIKDYGEIRRAATNIELAYERSLNAETKDKNAADQALVVSLNKMLDPGSVVRESEFARTPSGQAVIAQIEGKLQAIKTGGVGLTDQNRKEIMLMAQDLFKGARQHASKDMDPFVKQAKQFGVPLDFLPNKDLIALEFNSIEEAEAANLPSGTMITIGGRRAVVD